MSEPIVMTSWCGGEPGNNACDFSCKLCLILTGKAQLIKADDKKLRLTYRIIG